MKRLLLILMMMICMIPVGCMSLSRIIYPEDKYPEFYHPEKYTFEYVSQPFLDQYSKPEEIKEYKSETCHSISWY